MNQPVQARLPIARSARAAPMQPARRPPSARTTRMLAAAVPLAQRQRKPQPTNYPRARTPARRVLSIQFTRAVRALRAAGTRQAWVHTGLPLAVSLATHGAVLILAAVFSVGMVPSPKHVVLSADVAAGLAAFSDMTALTSAPNTTDVERIVLAPTGAAASDAGLGEGVASLPDARALLVDVQTADEPIIGLGEESRLDDPNRDDPRAGSLAGLRAGLADQQRPLQISSPFVSRSLTARRIVFLCDASGSMIPNFFNVQQELAATINGLRPFQLFNVIFYKNNESIAWRRGGEMMQATGANKRDALAFARTIRPEGRTDPLPAIRAAFAQQPDLVYVLSDGFDNAESLQAVRGEFRRQNQAFAVTVNTVLIRGSADPQLEEALRAIASENGGMCKLIQNDPPGN